MKTLGRFLGTVALVLAGCGDDSHAVSLDAGGAPDSGMGGMLGAMDAGKDAATPGTMVTPAPGPVMTVMCADQMCSVTAQEAMFGVQPCCIGTNECGQMTPLNPGLCLALGQPGGIDPTCPAYDVASITTWSGCCAPGGKCGALDSSEGGFGCVPNADLGQPEQSCDYDPNNACTSIIDVRCDGSEDCPRGQMCCGHWAGDYRDFTCQDDCAALEAQGDIWSEICHPGQTCADPTYTCQANTNYLPDFLYRCRDSGTAPGDAGSTRRHEVNCGGAVCGDGEKCCVPAPTGDPYCAPVADDCRCNAGGEGYDAGAEDAG